MENLLDGTGSPVLDGTGSSILVTSAPVVVAAFVQSAYAPNGSTASAAPVNVAITSTSGNTLVCYITAWVPSPVSIESVSDSAGNQWVYSTAQASQNPPVAQGYDAAQGAYGFSAIAVCVNAAAVTEVTVTLNGQTEWAEVGVSEFSGVPGNASIVAAAATGTVASGITTYSPPAITTTVATLAVATASPFNGFSGASSGWNLIAYTDHDAAYNVAAPAGTVQPVFTGSGDVPSSAVLAIGPPPGVVLTTSGAAPGGALGASGTVLVAHGKLTMAGSAAIGATQVSGALVVGEATAPAPVLLQPPVVNNWLSGDTLDAASLNTYARDTFTYLANPPLLRVQQTTQQTGIPAATWTVVNLQQVIEDTYNGWSQWNDGNAYQAQAPGWYSLTLNVSADVPAGALGRVGYWYWSTENGVWTGPVEFGQQVVGPGALYWTWPAYDETYLQVGDLVFPVFYHQASVSVNTNLSSPSAFEVTWISS